MIEYFEKLPIVGTLPQWLMLVTVFLAAVKIWPVLRQQTFEYRDKTTDRLERELKTLKEELAESRLDLAHQKKSCDEDNEKFKAEIRGLHEEIFGMRRQHVAEQISLINLILKNVDAPELRGMLKLFEQVQDELLRRPGMSDGFRVTEPDRTRTT